jgi:predicted O-linked N-acetylglucosamine transferase (SPINDLY family)
LADADALFARALALEDAGQADEALKCYWALLEQAPGHEDAWHNQGLLLARLGRFGEAEASHRTYLARCPDSGRARSDLVDVLLALNQNAEALAHLDWLVQRLPADVPSLVRRGVTLACLRRFAEARDAFAHVRAHHDAAAASFLRRVTPNADADAMLSPQNIYLGRRYIAQGSCDWRGWDDYIAEWRRAAHDPGVVVEAATTFMALHLPLAAEERHAIARRVAARIEAATPPMTPPGARREGRIRIGVLSPDFREHLNAHLLLPLFELCDRSRFEIHAYSLAPDDGSAIRSRVRAAADGFVDLQAQSDADAAALIHRHDIDLLVDAGGHTTGARFGITARRPARLQVLYLGFAASLGSSRVDYALVDEIVGANAAEWSEARVFLPDTYYLYDFRTPTPELPLARREYGLPDDGFVYCAFHKAEKITPDAFALWLEVLAATPGSVLWLLALQPAALANLRSRARQRGIDGARLVPAPFDPRDRYLARQHLGDLFLDTVHHSAMTTACDALGAGLPVLTLKGSAMASRAGESILRAAGLGDLVAADAEAFVAAAVKFAADPASLRAVAIRLRDARASAPLFDTEGRVRALFGAFEEMHARAQRGEPPRSIKLRQAPPRP